MGCFVVFFLIVLAIVAVVWSVLIQLLTAFVPALLLAAFLRNKHHLYWIVPFLNWAMWEFYLKHVSLDANSTSHNLPIAIYLTGAWTIVAGLVAAALAHGIHRGMFGIVQSELESEGVASPLYRLRFAVMALPFAVLLVGWSSAQTAPSRLSGRDVGKSIAVMRAELPTNEQHELDHAINILFSRTICSLGCKSPSECSMLGFAHHRRTASELIAVAANCDGYLRTGDVGRGPCKGPCHKNLLPRLQHSNRAASGVKIHR